MSEELEKLRHKQYVAERKLTAAKHKEKRLQSELKRLTRSERTHRLCTRAGMLETFLKEPTVLTDEDVMELLTFIFQSEAVQKMLQGAVLSLPSSQDMEAAICTKAAGGRMASSVRGSSAKRKPYRISAGCSSVRHSR